MRKKDKVERYKKILRRRKDLYLISEDVYANRKKDGVAEKVGSYVLAPAVFTFCNWLIQEAEKQKIQRLYFLARDGYQFYQCTAYLCKKWEIPIDCRYLKCSRYSLRLPLFHKMGEEALEYICLGGLSVNFRSVMQRAGICEETEITAIAEETGFAGRVEEELSYRQVQSLRGTLAGCRLFMERMTEHSRASYETASAYLRQEGLLEPLNYALVDSGWTGSIQKILQSFLLEEGDTRRLHGFYWGLYELPAGAKTKEYQTFYFGIKGNYSKKVHFNNCLFEAVFSAPHGMTLGYQKEDGVIRAVPDEKHNQNQCYIEEQAHLVMQYVHLATVLLKRWEKKDIRHMQRILSRLLRAFMAYPDQEEAWWYGTYAFSDDVREKEDAILAERLDATALREYHILRRMVSMYGKEGTDAVKTAWYEASAVLYGHHVGWHLWQQRGYKYLIYIRKSIKRRTRR